ncbi:sensor histidine kinase [Actinomadura macra]|uniref:sensor histidine kinase n=1 Tax=Actinomadura macra TaxID=46164 RepID=UPI0009FDE734|nr:sensor histidine kinase KdpD [Actinomadura macra]
MARGQLRIYLGAAPGVGKTYAMLSEAHRRAERGTDVVVGYVETHDRPRTAAQLEGLEVLPRARFAYRGAEFTELDVTAVIDRAPEVVLVDELAHTNAPGGRHGKRWRDVEDILDAGIHVISTVNVQHLESVNDVVEEITGVPQRETVPDEVVRRADQVELVDMAPEALRRRMAHGNVYTPEKVDAALSHYFRVGNLTALRELALLWLAGKVDDQLDRYRSEHGIGGTWEARERIVVALTGGPEGEALLRRATRIAARSKGADLLAVHVARGDGLAGARPRDLARQREIVEGLGGTYHQVVGDDIPRALLDFAGAVNATQLVLGVSRRRRIAQLLRPGIGVTTTAMSGTIDVHMVTHDQARRGIVRPVRDGGLSGGRRLAGFLLAACGLPLLTFGLLQARPALALPSDILFFLAAVVGVALVGGMWPALLTAVAGFLLLNWYFTPPLHHFTVAEQENLISLAVFVLVAVGVSLVVDHAARRSREAAKLGGEAGMLSALAGNVLRGERALDALLGRLRETFGLTSVTLLERPAPATPDSHGDPSDWRIVATVGGRPCTAPGEGDTEIPVGDDLTLAIRGRPLPAGDRRVLEAFAVQAAGALRHQRLEAEAERARPLEAADRMRTALLNAVSHDLRTPLASAKAAVDSLATSSVEWTPSEREELLDTARQSLDRLDRLVANLLDMSRLQAGVLGIAAQPIALEEMVPRALDDLLDGRGGEAVSLRLGGDLPEVTADPALLERILVNLIANALRHSPPGSPVLITAGAIRDRVELRIADRGPGVPRGDRERIFLPFQRLDDRDNHTGVGLGLALARGLTEAMGGELVPEDTPGGGLTMIVALPVHRRVLTGPDEGPAADPGADPAKARGEPSTRGEEGAS